MEARSQYVTFRVKPFLRIAVFVTNIQICVRKLVLTVFAHDRFELMAVLVAHLLLLIEHQIIWICESLRRTSIMREHLVVLLIVHCSLPQRR